MPQLDLYQYLFVFSFSLTFFVVIMLTFYLTSKSPLALNSISENVKKLVNKGNSKAIIKSIFGSKMMTNYYTIISDKLSRFTFTYLNVLYLPYMIYGGWILIFLMSFIFSCNMPPCMAVEDLNVLPLNIAYTPTEFIANKDSVINPSSDLIFNFENYYIKYSFHKGGTNISPNLNSFEHSYQ